MASFFFIFWAYCFGVITLLQLFYRTTVIYIIIIAAMRLMGKRQISEMQPGELVTTIMISNIVTLPIEDASMPLLTGMMPTLLLICYEVFSAWLCLKIPRYRKVITGSSIPIIEKGVILQNNLKQLRMTCEELIEQLRLGGEFDIQNVYYAFLETNGELSILSKNNDKSESVSPPPIAVIIDKKIYADNLKVLGLDENWLQNKLKNKHYTVNDLFLALWYPDKQKMYYVEKESK